MGINLLFFSENARIFVEKTKISDTDYKIASLN